LSIDKCKSITFCNKRKNIILSEYRLSNSILSSVNEIKDFGVVFDSRLTFKCHYHLIFQKSLNMWGFIWRNCRDLSLTALKTHSLVRSNLEYRKLQRSNKILIF